MINCFNVGPKCQRIGLFDSRVTRRCHGIAGLRFDKTFSSSYNLGKSTCSYMPRTHGEISIDIKTRLSALKRESVKQISPSVNCHSNETSPTLKKSVIPFSAYGASFMGLPSMKSAMVNSVFVLINYILYESTSTHRSLIGRPSYGSDARDFQTTFQ